MVSRVSTHPVLCLAVSVVHKAIEDVRSPDTVSALDALLWWVSGECELWLDAIGYEIPLERVLVSVLGGGYAKEKRES